MLRLDPIRNLMTWLPNRLGGALLGRAKASRGPDFVPNLRQVEVTRSVSAEVVKECARRAGLDTLPNDLTRMLYLASLRDCNSGRYLHPQLSRWIGVEEADRALCACHDEVFRHLLTTPISGFVLQLEQYIGYTGAERETVLKTWHSLHAYRATVPVLAVPISAELFRLNIEAALTILKDTRRPVDTWFHGSSRRC
jgi:hypothetical protein